MSAWTRKWLIHWLVVTLVILMSPYLIPGVRVEGPGAALAAAAVLGVLNTLVRPLVILFTLPLTILTLGLFLIVVNSSMVYLTGAIVGGFSFASFWSALWLGLLISLATTLFARPMTKDGGWAFSFRQDGNPRFRKRQASASPTGFGSGAPQSSSASNVVELNEKDGKWQ